MPNLPAFYHEVITHKFPGPASFSYFIPVLLLNAALCIPSSGLSRSSLCLFFLPAIYACQIHACIHMGTVDVISNNIALWSLLCLGLRDVRKDFKYVWKVQEIMGNGAVDTAVKGKGSDLPEDRQNGIIEGVRPDTIEERYPSTLFTRITWVSTLLISLRLNNWKTGDPDHDKKQPPKATPPRKLLVSALTSIISSQFILELTSVYTHSDPYFHQRGYSASVDNPLDIPFFTTPSTAPSPISPLLTHTYPLLPRLIRCSILAAQIYALVPFLFNCCIPLALLLHHIGILPSAFSPHTWPPVFGSFWLNVPQRGLRGLWGGWWHQMNRITTAAPGRALAESLGLKVATADGNAGGWKAVVGYMIVVCSAFGFSGLMHMGLVPPVPRDTSMTPSEMRWRVGSFFWVQVPGFAVELLVARVATRFLSERLRTSVVCRGLTLVWTAAFLCVTLPVLFPAFRELGYWRVWPVPVSLVHGLSGQGWLPWAGRGA